MLDMGYVKPNVLKKKAMELIRNPTDTVSIYSIHRYTYSEPIIEIPAGEVMRSYGYKTENARASGPPSRSGEVRELIGTVRFDKEMGVYLYQTSRGMKFNEVVLTKNGYPVSKKKSKKSDDFTWDALSKIDRIEYK